MKKVIIKVTIVAGLITLVGGHFFNKWYHDNIKKHPQMYAYQEYYGPPNPILIIENLKYRDSYIEFYNSVSVGNNPSFSFPLKTLPMYDPVYVMGYTSDSVLADIVSYYDRGAYFGGNYLRGWVYTKCLHSAPPPRKEK